MKKTSLITVCVVASLSWQKARADVLSETPNQVEYSMLEQDDIEPLFHQLAKEVTFFPINDFSYDRDRFFFGSKSPDDARRYIKLKEILSREKNGIGTLQNLLRDENPKVWTLALAALFTKTDAQQTLPYFASFADDDAPTFDGHSELSEDWLSMTGIGPPQKAQTVGYIARAMLRFFMTRSGFSHGFDGYSYFSQEEKKVVLDKTPEERERRANRLEPGFAFYWNERKDRTFAAGWFEVQLDRARKGQSPLPEGVEPRLRALKNRIAALPRADRNWTILSFRAPDNEFTLYSEDEVVAACKELGSKNLMLMLQNRIPFTDPDLQPNSSPNGFKYTRMRAFVLKHAKTLLRRDDAAALLAQEKNERRPVAGYWVSSQWAIAAADLQPTQAKTILYNAWKRFAGENEEDDRMNLVLALLKTGGQQEVAFARTWIFTKPQIPSSYSGTRGVMLDMLRTEGNKNSQALATALVADARLDTLNFDSLRGLIELVNRWLPAPIVSKQEMYSAYRGAGEAKAMTQWRQKLRASVPQWNKTPKP